MVATLRKIWVIKEKSQEKKYEGLRYAHEPFEISQIKRDIGDLYGQGWTIFQQMGIKEKRHEDPNYPDESVEISQDLIKQVEIIYQQIKIKEKRYEDLKYPDEPLEILVDLAEIYHAQGKYEQAEIRYKRALDVYAKMPVYIMNGPQLEDPYVVPDQMEPLCGLASLYQEQGKYEQARPLLQRALYVSEHLPTKNPNAVPEFGKLAQLLVIQGEYKQAEVLYKQILTLCEEKLVPEHRFITLTLSNLAEVYLHQEQYEQAEILYRRTLTIHERLYGSDHPEVAKLLNNLANLYYYRDKYAEAEPFYQRALHIWEQQLGPEHPQVAHPLNNLASLYHVQGKYAKAEPLCQRALSIREQQLGLQHPDTVASLKQLGPEHPNTVTIREHYNDLVRDMKQKGKGQS